MDPITYFNVLRHPEQTLKKDKKNASTQEAMKSYALMGVVQGIILGAVFLVLGTIIGTFFALGELAPLAAIAGGFGIIALIVMPVLLGGLAVLTSYIWNGILWLVATKLLGGKGTFAENYYIQSRVIWPMFFASTIISIIGAFIPVINVIVPIVWTLYSIYIAVVAVAVANNFSKKRGLITLLLPTILIGIILFATIFTAIAGALAVTSI